MKLLDNETITSKKNNIILTNHRIIINDEQLGKSYSMTIFLENISSIESLYKSNPVFLICSAITFIGGFGYEKIGIGLTLSLIFILLWWFSKKRLISIKSDGGSTMEVLTEKIKKNDLENFVFILIKEKHNRINTINNTNKI